jgi:hypothetical protein
MSWRCVSSGQRWLLLGDVDLPFHGSAGRPNGGGGGAGRGSVMAFLLFVVTCNGLTMFLASSAEGETTRHLLGWEELLDVVCYDGQRDVVMEHRWSSPYAGGWRCCRGWFVLGVVVALYMVVSLDACITVLVSVLPRVIDVRSGVVSGCCVCYTLCCGVVCTISTPYLIQYVVGTLLEE